MSRIRTACKALWEQGDMVPKTTLSILFIMSLGSWYIIFTKLYETVRRIAAWATKRTRHSGLPARFARARTR
jgi:biopolymer transport protein ExbB/TolQ